MTQITESTSLPPHPRRDLDAFTPHHVRESKGSDLAARLAIPEAVLSRTDLRELGYERRAVDAIFRACPVEAWEGYSRPLIRVADFLEWRERVTYRGDRVRPVRAAGV